MKPALYRSAIITFILLTVLTFVFAAYSYPLFTTDSSCFMPASYFINHAGKLINPLYDANIDVVGHRFIFYPPLFPYTVAYLARIFSAWFDNFFVILTILDTLTILLLLYSIYYYFKTKKISTGKLVYVFVPVLVITIFSFQGINTGRPEILCRLFITLFLLNNIRVHKSMYVLNGLIIGLNAITSPISTFYLVIIAAYLLAYRHNFKLPAIGKTLGGAILIFGAFLLLYPYHITELIHSMGQHSKNVIFSREGNQYLHNFITNHLKSPDTPLSFITFGICFLYILYTTVKKRNVPAGAFLLVLVLLISYFTFKDMALTYNLYVLSPIVCFLLPVIFTDELYLMKPLFKKALQPILLIVLFINCAGLLRKAVILYAVKDQYVSAQAFRHTFLNTLDQIKPHQKILISTSLWPQCLDKADQVLQYRLFDQHDPVLRDTSVRFLLCQQNYSGQRQPMEFAGFKLIGNQFIESNKKIAGLSLFNTCPGYQVAIYERK